MSDVATISAPVSADLAYQTASLQKVSRTFALTIPQLPLPLATVVGNAYLLCRIADTIEDSAGLKVDQKIQCSELFADAVAGRASADTFVQTLAPLLDASSSEAEHDLIQNTPRVLRVTAQFPPDQRAALERCVRIMADGMEAFQEGQFTHGLRDVAHLDAYCYHVAGVVGEMLTDLFCSYSPRMARHRERLGALAVSFGQGLQMTNIIKDIWDDKARNVCWLPQQVFDRYDFDLATLSTSNHGDAFQKGLTDLIAIARGHLQNALEYTLLIPRREAGIRTFCLLALGMAVLTLRNIYRRLDFVSGQHVKISRQDVRNTVLATRLMRRSNMLLRKTFGCLAADLPQQSS